jgi:hypothetical protein
MAGREGVDLLDGAVLLEEELSRDVPPSVVGEFRERPMICWRLRTGLNSCPTKWSSREQEVPFRRQGRLRGDSGYCPEVLLDELGLQARQVSRRHW